MRRVLKIIGLLCKRDLYKRVFSAKGTYIFKEPTNRSHPIIGDFFAEGESGVVAGQVK